MVARAQSSEMFPVDERHGGVALAVLAMASVVLAIAWAFQLVGGFTPCKLCLEQREGYYASIPVLVVVAIAVRLGWPAIVPRGLLVVAGLFFATSLVTGVFQAGAEWLFWPGPNDCGSGGLPTTSGGSLLDELDNTRVIFCDEAALRVLGLSFAGWNVLSAGALALVCFVTAAWPAKKG